MSLPAQLSVLRASGGAERQKALETLEKQLICPICLEIFNKPVVILPCQHNLCRKCANELYQPSLLQPRTTMLINSGRFRCPSCRQEVVLDRHGVFGLQRNLLVENIIDVYKQEVSESSSSPLPLPPPSDQLTCPDHPGEKVNIYCVSCQRPTCSLCKVFGAHQACQVAPLTDICHQKKEELRDGIAALLTNTERVQRLICELEEASRSVQDNCRTQKQMVCEKFQKMLCILEERRKAMTERITSEQQEKTGHIQALRRCYGDSLEANSKLVERVVGSMEEPDMAAFVQSSRELITKAKVASSFCPAEKLEPGYGDLGHYRWNFREQERALKSVDFDRAEEEAPEEPELEPQTEESVEPTLQNTEPPSLQEPSVQDLGSPREQSPLLIFQPEEPVPTEEPPLIPFPSASEVLSEPMVPDCSPMPVLQLLPAMAEENHDELDQLKDNMEQEEGWEVSDSEKARNACDEEEGMTTTQCDDGGAGRELGQDAQNEEQEPSRQDDIDAMFYPGWYKPNSWWRLRSDTAEPGCLDDPPGSGGDSSLGQEPAGVQDSLQPPEAPVLPASQQHPPISTQLSARPYTPPSAMTNPSEVLHLQLQDQENLIESQLLLEPDGDQALHQRAAEGDLLEEGWVCLTGAEEGLDLASESPAPSPIPLDPHGKSCEEDQDQLGDETAKNPEKELGDPPDVEGSLEVEGTTPGVEVEVMGERRYVSTLGKEPEGSEVKDGAIDQEEPRRSEEQSEAKPAEVKGKVTRHFPLKAVTLLFYLLAFLLILQRAWSYIGCFVCT